MLLHFRSCFILSVFFTHFNLSRLGSTLKLAGQGAFVRWSHLCQFQDSSHMSILYTGRIWGSAWSQNIPGFQPAPVITGVLITISSPNGASAANFQNFSNSSIRLDAFVDSPSTTVKALAVAPRIALLSTLPILPVHKCSHILPVCCYMLLYVAICCYMLLYVAICCYAHVTSSIHWTRWDSNTTQENMPPCDGDVGPKFSELCLSHSVTCIHWYPLCIWCFYWCALYISLYLYIILQ